MSGWEVSKHPPFAMVPADPMCFILLGFLPPDPARELLGSVLGSSSQPSKLHVPKKLSRSQAGM